jgi:hypothetical protein
MDPLRAEYWETATALELAVIAGDWQEARESSERLVTQSAGSWMLESTIANLNRLESAVTGSDLQQLQSVEAMLRSAIDVEEARNA